MASFRLKAPYKDLISGWLYEKEKIVDIDSLFPSGPEISLTHHPVKA
jgi:hypothetical protein